MNICFSQMLFIEVIQQYHWKYNFYLITMKLYKFALFWIYLHQEDQYKWLRAKDFEFLLTCLFMSDYSINNSRFICFIKVTIALLLIYLFMLELWMKHQIYLFMLVIQMKTVDLFMYCDTIFHDFCFILVHGIDI